MHRWVRMHVRVCARVQVCARFICVHTGVYEHVCVRVPMRRGCVCEVICVRTGVCVSTCVGVSLSLTGGHVCIRERSRVYECV